MASLVGFIGKVSKLPGNIEAGVAFGITESAKLTGEAILKSAEAAGWKLKSHGMGPVAVKTGRLGKTEAYVQASGGAAYAFQFGAKAHVITPRRAKALGRRGEFGPVFYAAHPGFRGRPYWDRGVNVAERLVPPTLNKGVELGMARTFG